MKVKICGFTQPKNAREVALLGIDAIGLVFYPKSPRFVDNKTADEIILNLPPFVNSVGLFVNEDYEKIDDVLCSVTIDTLQFHGQETRAECEQYEMPYLKSVAVDENTNLEQIAEQYHNASGLLLDTPSEYFGGTGKAFDWSLLEKSAKIEMPIILAGGLNPQNIANAIKQVRPYAVDVSSGVESSKGVKDIVKVKQFLQEIKQ
jgi:phosphoribosylanthranilate isomerase